MGTILIPRGILLHCTATYCDFDGARVNSHFVPLAMAAGPRLFQYLHDHDNPLVTSLICAWSPAHTAMDTITLRSSIARMLQRGLSSALTCDNKTIQKQLMKPISNCITEHPSGVCGIPFSLPMHYRCSGIYHKKFLLQYPHRITALWWIFGMIYSLGHPPPSALVSLPGSPVNPSY